MLSIFLLTTVLYPHICLINNASTIYSIISNNSSVNVHFEIENSDEITINLISPLNGSIVNGDTEIHLNFTDSNNTLVSPVTELYRWDKAANFESILRPLPMEDGSHTLEVEVESESGIWTYANYLFISDNEEPNIILNSPDNITFAKGGDDIVYWLSGYPDGSLSSIDIIDITSDGIPDTIVGSGNGRIYTVDGRLGDPIYTTIQYPSPVSEIKIYNNSKCLIGLSNGNIRSLNASTGQTLWSNNTFTSSPVISISDDSFTDTLYVLVSHGLYAFNYSGYNIWSYNNTKNNESVLMNEEFSIYEDVIGDSTQEIITINQSSFVMVINSTNGELIYNFTISGDFEDSFIRDDYIYLSTTYGYVHKYNMTSASLNWSTNVETGQNIYQVKFTDNGIMCSTGNGLIALLNEKNGSIIWSSTVSSSYIKNIVIDDFDEDLLNEVLITDGDLYIKNIDVKSGILNWDYQVGGIPSGILPYDFNNDTHTDLVLITTNGEIIVVDPRGYIPYSVPSWTNVSISFTDAISGNVTVWEKYSWDGGQNQSTVGVIPTPSGMHTLDVWVSDNASNIAHARYQFYAIIGLKLNSPQNNSYQQSGTPINITLSETPLEKLFKWDSGSFQSSLSDLPAGEFIHDLYVKLKDQSNNYRNFRYVFYTDDTEISSITLLSPQNDSIVEGNETIDIQFSEIPFIEYYSWDGSENITDLSTIPVSSDTHILDIYAADSALNWKYARFVFHTKILISLISHENNTIIVPFISINFTFGEKPDVYGYQINEMPFQSFNDHNKSVNVTLPSVSQTYRITLRVNDSLNGRWNNETYVFIIKILVNITSHSNSGFVGTGDTIEIYYSDTPVTKLFSWDEKKNSSRTPTVPSPDGPHYLDIYVGNIEGHFWHYHYDFNVDTDLIDILLISPVNNTKIHSWENITIDFSETPYISQYRWDNNSATTNITNPPNIDGGHVLNVTVFDEASNINSKEFYWIIDDTPINITLLNYNSSSNIFTGEYLNISFNNETPEIEWYCWDNEAYSPTLPPNPYSNGTHTLNITVSDGLNWAIKIFSFNVTDIPPSFLIEDINKPYMSNVIININVTEELVESWHRWDNNSKINNLYVVTPNLNDGDHILQIFGRDLGGSSKTIKYSIEIDNTPIKILNVNPTNGSYVNGGENITIEYDETPHEIIYSWNGESKTNYITPIPSIIGEDLILNIVAYDEAGNLLIVNLEYYIATEEEKFAERVLPLGVAFVFTSAVVGSIVFIKRDFFSPYWEKFITKIKPPKRIEE